MEEPPAATRSGDLADVEALTFAELDLSAPVLRGLAEAGFEQPSPIQARAIPLGRFGVDLIAQAKSGTGKTVVFAVIALELARPNQPAPQVLIVAPTREIALQSRDVCRQVGAHVRGVQCHAFVGGTPVRTDKALATTCHLACGTPGRLVGLLLSEALVADRVRLLVLDEADKLCDDNFEDQLRYLLTALPQRKQALAFSATYPAHLLAALRASMRDPLTISLLPTLSDHEAAAALDDPSDPLALLERPHALGRQAQSGVDDGAGDARAGDEQAGGERLPCGAAACKGRARAAVGGGAGSATALGSEMVGGAALLGVGQFYKMVSDEEEPSGHDGGVQTELGGNGNGDVDVELDDHAGVGEADGGRSRTGRGVGGDDLKSSRLRGKQLTILRLLDTLSFHQALIFCNQPEQARHGPARAPARAPCSRPLLTPRSRPRSHPCSHKAPCAQRRATRSTRTATSLPLAAVCS